MCWEPSEHPECAATRKPQRVPGEMDLQLVFVGMQVRSLVQKFQCPGYSEAGFWALSQVYLTGAVVETVGAGCLQGRTPNKGIPGPVYPDSPCTWFSPAPHTPCTHLFVHRWFLVWGLLAPYWIFPLSHSGSVADFMFRLPYLPVCTGLRAAFYITKQELKTSSD